MRWVCLAMMLILLPCGAWANDWPAAPPKIGSMVMPQRYWLYTLEAAMKHNVSPYIIQGFMVIESRYNPKATSGRGRCIGLMQLHRDTAKSLDVNPWAPKENIDGGTRVLSRLLKKYHGNLRRVMRIYNAESNGAYEREVFKAISQAKSRGER